MCSCVSYGVVIFVFLSINFIYIAFIKVSSKLIDKLIIRQNNSKNNKKKRKKG